MIGHKKSLVSSSDMIGYKAPLADKMFGYKKPLEGINKVRIEQNKEQDQMKKAGGLERARRGFGSNLGNYA